MPEIRHSDLARDLAQGITSGRFPVGSLLPTEMELCEQFGASRHTVRKALGELQDLGLVSRRKHVGTRVEATRPSASFSESLASMEDLVQFGATHVRVVRKIDEVTADRALARELGSAVGSRWLRISSLRLDQAHTAEPIGWTDVYVEAAYADLRTIVRKSPQTLISDLIEKKYGRHIAEVRQTIEAVGVPAELAEELKSKPGSPALKIVRRYLDQTGAMFEVSVTIHPTKRFRLSMRLRRERVTAS
ncbi:MAG TPA: GntR family transcriptional regulator [Burkholderiaceae bacterium]|nr:GntR family transcriptional regulator [Burkholderiaceae bacterium]